MKEQTRPLFRFVIKNFPLLIAVRTPVPLQPQISSVPLSSPPPPSLPRGLLIKSWPLLQATGSGSLGDCGSSALWPGSAEHRTPGWLLGAAIKTTRKGRHWIQSPRLTNKAAPALSYHCEGTQAREVRGLGSNPGLTTDDTVVSCRWALERGQNNSNYLPGHCVDRVRD